MDIKVRPLVVDDLFTVAKIIAKATDAGMKALANMKDASDREVGMAIITVGLTHAEKETKAWLADLVGITPEELGNMPVMTALDIAEQLIEQEDIQAFFTRASALAKKLVDKK